jgi:protein gp37
MEPLLEDLGEVDLIGLHWVIVGGESGPKARPMKPEWVLNIQRQCDEQEVAFFFKQWGGWGVDGMKRGKKQNGRLLNGRTWDAVPRMQRRQQEFIA